jgi:hypothetical protein
MGYNVYGHDGILVQLWLVPTNMCDVWRLWI